MADWRVLVADDDETLRGLMVRRLEHMGIHPDTAADGRAALVRIEREDYDLIVTDIYMPGATGLDLLRRAKERDAHVQVVVVTAGATLENAVEALNEGAFGYLNKPFDHISVFENTIARALEFRRLVLDNARMAKAQRRRGDLLEEEITDRVLQLRQRQMELLDLLGVLSEGVVVVEEDGRTPLTSAVAERWLARELRFQRQPIRRFIETVHTVDGVTSEEVSLDTHVLILRGVDIPEKNGKRRKVVLIQDKRHADNSTIGNTLDVIRSIQAELAQVIQQKLGGDVLRRLAVVTQRLLELESNLGGAAAIPKGPIQPTARDLEWREVSPSGRPSRSHTDGDLAPKERGGRTGRNRSQGAADELAEDGIDAHRARTGEDSGGGEAGRERNH